MFRGSLCFRAYFFCSGIFRASFLKDDKYPVSNNININYIRLVNVFSGYCSLAYTGASRSFMFTQWSYR